MFYKDKKNLFCPYSKRGYLFFIPKYIIIDIKMISNNFLFHMNK